MRNFFIRQKFIVFKNLFLTVFVIQQLHFSYRKQWKKLFLCHINDQRHFLKFCLNSGNIKAKCLNQGHEKLPESGSFSKKFPESGSLRQNA